MKGFRSTEVYTVFDHKKEWRNFGRVESGTSWRETKKIQTKLATTCNVARMDTNIMPVVMLNCRPNGRRRFERPWKRLLDEAETGLSRPNWWRMMIMTMMYVKIKVKGNNKQNINTKLDERNKTFTNMYSLLLYLTNVKNEVAKDQRTL